MNYAWSSVLAFVSGFDVIRVASETYTAILVYVSSKCHIRPTWQPRGVLTLLLCCVTAEYGNTFCAC